MAPVPPAVKHPGTPRLGRMAFGPWLNSWLCRQLHVLPHACRFRQLIYLSRSDKMVVAKIETTLHRQNLLRYSNVILIMSDQQCYDTVAALGSFWVRTPNLDRLVREGVCFDQCYCAAPSCVPSRANFFNMCYPHITKVNHSGCAWGTSWVAALERALQLCRRSEWGIGSLERYGLQTNERKPAVRSVEPAHPKRSIALPRGKTRRKKAVYG